MQAQGEPVAGGEESADGNFVEISNISPLLSVTNLRELFECCGTIKLMDSRKRMGMQGEERFCIVQFSNSDEQQAAVLLTGTQLGEKTLVVKKMSFEEVREMIVETNKAPETTQSAVDEVEKARQQVEAWAQAPPQAGFGGERQLGPDGQPIILTEADRIREEQIRRTIYVGNLDPQLVEEHVKEFFSTQGEMTYVKMSAPGLEQRYCFVEFADEASAKRSFSLSGTVLGDRAIKIGTVTTPISKTVVPSNILANPVRLSNAMSHVRCALEELNKRKSFEPSQRPPSPPSEQKMEAEAPPERTLLTRLELKTAIEEGKDEKSRSSSTKRKKKRRRRRSYSRSRSRSRRKSRRRRRRRSPTRSRSRSRSYERLRSSRFWKRSTTTQHSRQKDMVWDGFQWHPKNSTEGKATKSAAQLGLRGPAGYPNANGLVCGLDVAAGAVMMGPGTGAGGVAAGLGAQLAQQALRGVLGAPPGI